MTNKKILIVFASKYGASAEIAGKIEEVLTTKGLEVYNEDSKNFVWKDQQYDAVVAGSAVYAGNWLPHASSFLINNVDKLTDIPVWIFSSGPTGDGDAVESMKGWLHPIGLKSTIEKIKPMDIKLFHGDLNMKKLNFFEKLIVKLMKAPQGDFRNWKEIEAWTNSIAEELNK